jgi:diguanylate cyclase (GGDEF)-like protein
VILLAGDVWWSGLYVLVAVVMLVSVPAGHSLQPATAGVAMLAFVLAGMIKLPLSVGYAGIIQPAFVLMLFALPLDAVPAVVAIASGVSVIARRRGFRWVAVGIADSWFCVTPVLVLALGAPGPARWSHWPVYAAAFAAQMLFDGAIGAARRARDPEPPRRDRSIVWLPMAVDGLLTPVGLAAAVSGGHDPGATVAVLGGALGVMVFLGRERKDRLVQEQRALRDPLTGLANRALFDELLETAARRCGRSGTSGAVLLLDLNDFKAINDRHGHLCGDRVLCEFAELLLGRVRSADSVARLGGDEFAVLLADPVTIGGANAVADDLRAALAVPITIPDLGDLNVSASIGTASFGAGVPPIQAIADADRALYADKSARRLTARETTNDGLLNPGTFFAGYRVERVIARGGMGVVYAGTDMGSGEKVALKVIAPELVERVDIRQRFAREVRASRGLEHPHLVRVRSAGEVAGRPYVAMDLIDGRTLREELVIDGPMEPSRAAAIVGQVASALDLAHAQGMAHRDVKPANVLLTRREPGGEHTYLVDFGISSLLADETGLTRTGSWVGSVDYIAPESLNGARPDARSDVYALGCLLYELLTGSVPYPRDSDAAKLFAHINALPPQLDLHDQVTNGLMSAVVARALAKEPVERFSTAGSLAVAAIAAAGGVRSHPTPVPGGRGQSAPF